MCPSSTRLPRSRRSRAQVPEPGDAAPVTGAASFAHYSDAMPFHSARGNTPVVTAILTANVLVFLLWMFAPLPSMAGHFLVSWAHLEEGRVWTLLTAVFSHNALIHLFVNMIVLTSFAPALELRLGARRFLLFYLAAGIIGSLAHALVSRTLLDSPGQAALGASSALSGVLLLFSLLHPRARVLFFFIIPLPAVAAALIFIGLDIWGLIAQAEGGGLPIGHGAHLGGALTGILYFVLARPAPAPAQRPVERDRDGLH
jgi:membrane associated rhomboid family serine protease